VRNGLLGPDELDADGQPLPEEPARESQYKLRTSPVQYTFSGGGARRANHFGETVDGHFSQQILIDHTTEDWDSALVSMSY
jgi:hypothetical protein